MNKSDARISPALDAARCVLVLAVGQGYAFGLAALRAAPNGSAICARRLLSGLLTVLDELPAEPSLDAQVTLCHRVVHR